MFISKDRYAVLTLLWLFDNLIDALLLLPEDDGDPTDDSPNMPVLILILYLRNIFFELFFMMANWWSLSWFY